MKTANVGSGRSDGARRRRPGARGPSLPFDLVDLRYALLAADFGSFRQTAEALRIQQSTLGRRIEQLEKRVGVTLFERTRSGVRPTLLGQEFLRRAERLLAQAEGMTAAATTVARGETGRLTVGVYTSLSAGHLRAALIDYRNQHPLVELQVIQDTRESLLGALGDGGLDIAVVIGDPGLQDDGPYLPLWSERILVALPEAHPMAARPIVHWPDLKGETFLLGRSDPGQDFHDILVAKLGAPGDRPKVVRHDASGDVIKSLVGAGFGVSLLCDACAGAAYAGVVYREARDGNGPCRVGYTARWAAPNDNPALLAFLALLKARFPAAA